MRKFHLGDILTITTGILVAPRGVEAYYDILKYLTGEKSVFTHQVPRLVIQCKPFLLDQFPLLAAIDASVVTPKNYKKWMAEQIKKYGETFEVKSIPREAHTSIDPMDEAQAMVGDDKVIPVITD